MKSPVVSIIVPCFKQADFLPETLESVINQSYDNWECIIIDDGSPDNTGEIASLYCHKDSRFRYLRTENHGLASARNTGIINTTGEYILPLDSDDIIGRQYLEKAIIYYTEHPDCKLVYCRARLFGAENCEWNLEEYSYDSMLWHNMIFCSAIFKRKDYSKTQGYNPNMVFGWEDWDFWLSLLDKNDEVHRLDDVLFYYRIKEHSMSKSLTTHKKEIYKQICENHIHLYKDILGRELEFYSESMRLKRELQVIKSSRLYCTYKKITRFILRTFHISVRRKL